MLDIEEFGKKIDKKSRLLGIDPGKKRIGIAVCDENKIIATPYTTLIKNSFSELLENGRLVNLDNYSGKDINGNSIYDINYNAFTIDMLFRWVFFPGSELNIVWKSSIFNSDENVDLNYWTTFTSSIDNGPMNTLSIKLIYWLDAQYLKK